MQESKKHPIPVESHGLHNQSAQDHGSYCWPSIHNPSSDDGTQLSAETFEQYCTLESSCGSFSTGESVVSLPNSNLYASDLHDSPTSESYVADKLRELENVMLGPDADNLDAYNLETLPGPVEVTSGPDKWSILEEMVARRDLKELLCACAQILEEGDMFMFEWLVSELRQMVSVTGEPLQRLGAYMLEGLVARLSSSGSSIYKALRCKEPTGNELLSYMHLLYEVCPYFKFGYMSANGAIAEAMKDENNIHIIDFQIAQGSQWVTLIQALAGRPGGPPHIRVTGIDDDTSAYARGGGLDLVGKRLAKLAEAYNVPFEFNAITVSVLDIQPEDVEIRQGEAIAANMALMLHHMPDGTTGTQNHRDRLLRLIKSFSPKVVTLVEQESFTNTSFLPRFVETLDYYLAIFESVDVILPRDNKERINVEQHCLAREVVNVIACEGAERVERHELIGKWKSMFSVAGYAPYPLSSFVNAAIKTLMQNYSDKYTLDERDGALYLGWNNRPLIVSCAWR